MLERIMYHLLALSNMLLARLACRRRPPRYVGMSGGRVRRCCLPFPPFNAESECVGRPEDKRRAGPSRPPFDPTLNLPCFHESIGLLHRPAGRLLYRKNKSGARYMNSTPLL